MENKVHPFEARGLGKAPFKLIGLVELPSPSLAEHNPDAYNNALKMLPRNIPCGTCAHCGLGIKYNYLVESSDGHKHAVGSECVRKTSQKSLICEVAKKERERASEKREEAMAAAQAGTEKRKSAVRATWAFMVPILRRMNGGFCASVASSIEAGFEPQGRAVGILEEIYGKEFGRRGSAAYIKAIEEFNAKIQEAA